MDDAAARVAALYRGLGKDFWDRIEDERPGTYPEENLALGRRQEAALLRSWLEDRPEGLPGLRVLDAGCGRGRLALDLASRGARVTAVDLLPRFNPRALSAHRRRDQPEEPDLTLVVGDFRSLLHRGPEETPGPVSVSPGHAGAAQVEGPEPPFDALLLREVLQDYRADEQRTLVGALAAGAARRVFLTLRMESGWSRFLGGMWPEGLGRAADPVAVLRAVHLATPYRLTRQREVKRRNFRSWVGELTWMV